MDSEQFSRLTYRDLDDMTYDDFLDVINMAKNIQNSNKNYDSAKTAVDIALGIADFVVDLAPQSKISRAAKKAFDRLTDTFEVQSNVPNLDPLSTEAAQLKRRYANQTLEYLLRNFPHVGPPEWSANAHNGIPGDDNSRPGLTLGAMQNASVDLPAHTQKDADLSPATHPGAGYQDPIMRAAKNYPVSTSYQDPIMR